MLFPKEWNMVAAALYFPQLPSGITIAVKLSSEEYWNAYQNQEKTTLQIPFSILSLILIHFTLFQLIPTKKRLLKLNFVIPLTVSVRSVAAY